MKRNPVKRLTDTEKYRKREDVVNDIFFEIEND